MLSKCLALTFQFSITLKISITKNKRKERIEIQSKGPHNICCHNMKDQKAAHTRALSLLKPAIISKCVLQLS